jgi:DNA-binding LacI/PurR family transcriptional regulator
MADVAKLAGVSHMTVSRVINSSGSVREDTRQRVAMAMQTLGYRPNSAARALVTGKSRVLGVVSFDTTLFGPASTLFGIEQAAREAGYFISIVSLKRLDLGSILEAFESLEQQAVDGIIIIAPHVSAAGALGRLPSDIPLTVVGAPPNAVVPTVAVDHRVGAFRLTQHLLSLGHETVWHIAGPDDWLEAQLREAGWRHALEEAGRPVPPVKRGDWTPGSGYEIGLDLRTIPELTAVFAANDHMALGLYRALNEARIQVPQQVSVVGFDDVPEAAYLSPPLTTAHQDFTEVGRQSLSLLLQQMEGRDTQVPHQLIEPALVVRESSGPRRT